MKEKDTRSRAELAKEFMELPDAALVDEAMVMAITGMGRRHLQGDRDHRRGIKFRKVGRLVRYQKGDVLAYMSREVA